MLGSFIYEAERRRKIQVRFPAAIGLETLLLTSFIAAGIGSCYQTNIPPQPAGKFFVMVTILTGVIDLVNAGLRPLAGLVFTARIAIPFLNWLA